MTVAQAYPPAQTIAPRVWSHFAHHREVAERRGHERLAPLPRVDEIEAIVEAAFWASLRREEGYVPRISIAFLSPDEALHPLVLDRPLPLASAALTRVAPAVERAGIHLGVWRYEGDLCAWGMVRAIPTFCFVLEVAGPGLLVIKHHRGAGSGKFVNVAVLEGDEIKVIDEQASSLPDCPSLLTSLLGFGPSTRMAGSDPDQPDGLNVLVQLAASMRTHGRGGSLLVVPGGSDAWLESVVRPMLYAVRPPFAELAELARRAPEGADDRVWQEALNRAVDAMAGLTAVDGATVITVEYDLLAFGAKIARRKGSPQVEQVTVTEPIEGGRPEALHPSQLGGTRHLSAAQFVHDQRDTLALVASQDGRFTVFAWSSCERMVHAHRVEALLL